MIKIKLKALLLLGVFFLLHISCNDDKEWKGNIHELQYRLEGESALSSELFEVTYRSLGITSRTWTFKEGRKKCSLEFPQQTPKGCVKVDQIEINLLEE